MEKGSNRILSIALALTFAWSPMSCIKFRDAEVPRASDQETKPLAAAEKTKSPEYVVFDCHNNLINLDAAVDRYRVAHNRLPGSFKELVPDYINRIPDCPLNGAKYRLDTSGVSSRRVICPNGHRI